MVEATHSDIMVEMRTFNRCTYLQRWNKNNCECTHKCNWKSCYSEAKSRVENRLNPKAPETATFDLNEIMDLLEG